MTFNEEKRGYNMINFINKNKNKIHCIGLLAIAGSIHAMVKAINKHEIEITNLKNEIKELKLKGE